MKSNYYIKSKLSQLFDTIGIKFQSNYFQFNSPLDRSAPLKSIKTIPY
jgi:hypothetical protein